MGFLKILFRLLLAAWAAAWLFIGTIGTIIGVFGAPTFVTDELRRITESPQATWAWQLVALTIATIWFLLTEHLILVIIVFVGVALIRYLWGGGGPSKTSMKQEYEKVRKSFRKQE